ncbi:MAG TPA: hypothetical protein VFQ88_09625, partial [Nevskiaceae bacterium]|nr:hypothetical protein [Nevskiaceae bacterium]
MKRLPATKASLLSAAIALALGGVGAMLPGAALAQQFVPTSPSNVAQQTVATLNQSASQYFIARHHPTLNVTCSSSFGGINSTSSGNTCSIAGFTPDIASGGSYGWGVTFNATLTGPNASLWHIVWDNPCSGSTSASCGAGQTYVANGSEQTFTGTAYAVDNADTNYKISASATA